MDCDHLLNPLWFLFHLVAPHLPQGAHEAPQPTHGPALFGIDRAQDGGITRTALALGHCHRTSPQSRQPSSPPGLPGRAGASGAGRRWAIGRACGASPLGREDG